MTTATKILFTSNIWQCTAKVQLCVAHSEGTWIVTDTTPFHPVSHIWPDHPADRGFITVANQDYAVINCLVGAVELASQTLYVADAIPVRRDTEGWVFVVVHHLAQDLMLEIGQEVELSVDKAYQQALGRGHSGGHLSSLALNKVLHHDFWRKDASRKDELGHYDFHSYAQEKSEVSEDCSRDTYRLGKTLRKRGLNSADMLEQLNDIADKVNQQLTKWLELESAITMRCEGQALTDSRYWCCDLKEGNVIEIPCGGTHSQSLAEYNQLWVEFEYVNDQQIVMYTRSIKRQ
ncbi:TPA: alanyl-tRNA editing protein [Photobacterium damselae]